MASQHNSRDYYADIFTNCSFDIPKLHLCNNIIHIEPQTFCNKWLYMRKYDTTDSNTSESICLSYFVKSFPWRDSTSY